MNNGQISKEKVAVIMLLPDCNMDCPYCGVTEDFQGASFLEAQSFINKLKNEKYSNLILGGGEPTLWPGDVFKLGAFARSIGLFTQIGTNAIKLPEHFENLNSFDRWILPLDSAIEVEHNLLRPHNLNHHKVILKTLERLKEKAQKVYLSTVITSKNNQHLDQLCNWIESYVQSGGQVESWNLYRLLPLGRGPMKHYTSLQISEVGFNLCIDQLKKIKRSFKMTIRRNMYGSEIVDFFVYRNGQFTKLAKNESLIPD